MYWSDGVLFFSNDMHEIQEIWFDHNSIVTLSHYSVWEIAVMTGNRITSFYVMCHSMFYGSLYRGFSA